MTINEITSLIRGLIKEHSDDTYYTDQFIWKLFTVSKANILKQRADKFKYINPQNKITFCIELEKAYSHECGCIKAGCKVLKTKFKLPKALTTRNGSTLKLYTLDWKEIFPVEESDLEVNKYDEILSNQFSYSLVNNRPIIWDNLDLKAIQVQANWEDITEIYDIQYCNQTTNSNSTLNIQCVNPFELDIDIDIDLIYACLLQMFRLLNIPLSIIEDYKNNGKNEKN